MLFLNLGFFSGEYLILLPVFILFPNLYDCANLFLVWISGVFILLLFFWLLFDLGLLTTFELFWVLTGEVESAFELILLLNSNKLWPLLQIWMLIFLFDVLRIFELGV